MSANVKGILLTALFSVAAVALAAIPVFKAHGINPLIIGILLGIAYGNSLKSRLPADYQPGIVFSAKKILRLGVILYGFKLTFQEVFALGLQGIAVDTFMVFSTLILGITGGIYLLRLDRETAILTSAGSAICGAAAVLAADSAIKAPAHKVAVAVSTVVVFGTIAMFLMPVLYESGILDFTPADFGVYIGATTHEVAHVVAASGALGPEFSDTAIVSKMVRVMLLAPAVLLIALLFVKSGTKKHIAPPAFALWFIAVVGLNSLLSLPADVRSWIDFGDLFLLTMAMTALGMETNLKKAREIGPKPFLLATGLFVWLLLGGYGIMSLLY